MDKIDVEPGEKMVLKVQNSRACFASPFTLCKVQDLHIYGVKIFHCSTTPGA